ncbi:MAG TPA: NAD(P)H-hydrate dehydratase, partial [Burkholderiaceae bacterium]|nr:NAD(P)H-hydrate dehydratase [Burkholderiaceae bacterium]
MQRAGAAAAQASLRLLSGDTADTRILVIAGPGNNGGDALEAAAHLAQAGMRVTVLLYADPTKQGTDAQHALQRARAATVDFPKTDHFQVTAASGYALVLDGLFGIGLTRPITGTLRTLIEQVNLLNIPVLALDVPSGLNADSGSLIGDAIAVRATHTITFIGAKPGLYTGWGRDCAGEIEISGLGIDGKYFPQTHTRLTDVAHFAASLRQRIQNSHKGSYGSVIVLGGTHGMAGAPILAARAALNCGAGRVYAAFVGDAPAYDPPQPELMCKSASEIDLTSAVLVVGPGLGHSRMACDLLGQALDTRSPLVLDADALNLVASEPELQRKLAGRGGNAIITPHPLEAARLLASSSAQVQSDRLVAARELARRFNAIAVLKGSGTVVAHPDGDAAINP